MKYVCLICGYIYDEEKEGVPFDSLPSDWKCPLCGAAKSDFELMEEKKEVDELPKEEAAHVEKLEALTPGQMAALCSNLQRGCEKQYKTKEAKLFGELATYFSKITPPVKDPSVDDVAKRLLEEAKAYKSLRSTADSNSDRGAARVCVWGEKVTRMLSSLVNRYLTEGEKLLEGTNIWVCTVCGFVYIGQTPPELCPVCKVPDWKFEKIEDRSK
ncbi:MAG: rubredoxin [Sphaerochaetaceae bacterium]|nr:rubredoxin [Sphaerochaetaceae bacterium]